MRHTLGSTAVVVLSILLWETSTWLLSLPEYLIPRPSAIAFALWEKLPYFSSHAMSTLLAAVAGLAAAIVFGAGAALVFARYRRLAEVGEPLLGATQTVPILALAPILTAWLGPGIGAKIAAAAIVSFPSVATTLSGGLAAVRSDEVDLFRSMGATPWKLIRYLRVPRAMPYFFVAVRVAIPLALLGAVVGEFVGAERGLGVVILRASYYLRTTEMAAAVVVVSFLSILLIGALATIRRWIAWKE